MRSILKPTIYGSIISLSMAISTAEAQLNNKPYSFNTPGGSVGMSIGGRQAIINEKLDNTTPDNLVRSANGRLLDVRKVDGGNAIVSFRGGEAIPSFRGTSFRGDSDAWSSNSFNSYFIPNDGNSSWSLMASPQWQTSSNINTWTQRLVSSSSHYVSDNALNTWTGMVVQVVAY